MLQVRPSRKHCYFMRLRKIYLAGRSNKPTRPISLTGMHLKSVTANQLCRGRFCIAGQSCLDRINKPTYEIGRNRSSNPLMPLAQVM